jgi:hypothetical protein
VTASMDVSRASILIQYHVWSCLNIWPPQITGSLA